MCVQVSDGRLHRGHYPGSVAPPGGETRVQHRRSLEQRQQTQDRREDEGTICSSLLTSCHKGALAAHSELSRLYRLRRATCLCLLHNFRFLIQSQPPAGGEEETLGSGSDQGSDSVLFIVSVSGSHMNSVIKPFGLTANELVPHAVLFKMKQNPVRFQTLGRSLTGSSSPSRLLPEAGVRQGQASVRPDPTKEEERQTGQTVSCAETSRPIPRRLHHQPGRYQTVRLPQLRRRRQPASAAGQRLVM